MADQSSQMDANINSLSMSLRSLLVAAGEPEVMHELALKLKQQADLYWGIDPHVSLTVAKFITTIGEVFDNQAIQALGLMATGDAYRFLHRIGDAHASLKQAGEIFRDIGDEVGWARTRIGWLLASHEMDGDAIQQAIADAETARKIFFQHNENEFLIRLSINLSAFYIYRFEFSRARATLLFAMDLIGVSDDTYRAQLLLNLGIVEQADGRFPEALASYDEAESLFDQLNLPFEIASVRLNQAALWMLRGNYRIALHHMKDVHDKLHPKLQIINYRNQINCYQLLGDHDNAQRMCSALLNIPNTISLPDQVILLMFRCDSLIEVDQIDKAIEAFDVAEKMCREIDAQETLRELWVRRATIELGRNDLDAARKSVESVLSSEDLYVKIRANIILSYVFLREGDFESAIRVGNQTDEMARSLRMEEYLHQAQNLLGQIHEASGNLKAATHHYERANKYILSTHRNLSKDYRPKYLENKQSAFRNLVRAYLQQGQGEAALGIIETIKTFVKQQHFHETQTIDWEKSDRYLEMEAQLHVTRNDYLQLIAQTDSQNDPERNRLEQSMNSLIAEMRLHIPIQSFDPTVHTLEEIQASLAEGEGLLEYYTDGYDIVIFSLSQNTNLIVERFVSATDSSIARLSGKLKRSIRAALSAGSDSYLYLRNIQSTLRALYILLIEPVRDFIQQHETLTIVPYGNLHAIPFHLLYDGKQYLIENYTVTLKPASSPLITKTKPKRQIGTLALGYNENNKDYRMEKEAQAVAQIIGGEAMVDTEAVSQQLAHSTYQVLHLAAHGEHNTNYPRLSRITLGDGPLFMEDLWQFDMAYDLVMLSACEVGRGNPSGGDELIGLGSGFLYAGAQSVVSSLWKVDDNVAEAFAVQFYSNLKQGLNKSESLRKTQLYLMKDERFQHPAFWGAFQLTGDTCPL